MDKSSCLGASDTEQYGVVDRRFYPTEIDVETCENYKSGKVRRPIEVLEEVLEKSKLQRCEVRPGKSVVHVSCYSPRGSISRQSVFSS